MIKHGNFEIVQGLDKYKLKKSSFKNVKYFFYFLTATMLMNLSRTLMNIGHNPTGANSTGAVPGTDLRERLAKVIRLSGT